MMFEGLKNRLKRGPSTGHSPKVELSSSIGHSSSLNSSEGSSDGSAMSRWYFRQIAAAEQSRIEQQAKLAQLAWRVAAASMGLAAVVFLGSAALVMNKRPTPPVVIRDNTVTGQVDVIDVARSGMMPFGKAEAIADLRRYVEQREGYDYETIQSLYDSVTVKTCGPEKGRYTSLFASSEARSPLKVWKNDVRVIARAGAVTFVGATAQVFFERRYVTLNGAPAPATEYEVATIAYEQRNDPMRESELLLNPTGFCVLSYTVARDWTRADQAAVATPAPNGLTGVRR